MTPRKDGGEFWPRAGGLPGANQPARSWAALQPARPCLRTVRAFLWKEHRDMKTEEQTLIKKQIESLARMQLDLLEMMEQWRAHGPWVPPHLRDVLAEIDTALNALGRMCDEDV